MVISTYKNRTAKKHSLGRLNLIIVNRTFLVSKTIRLFALDFSVAEWFRALDLKSGGPWFNSSTLLLSGFVLGSPEFNSSTALCK